MPHPNLNYYNERVRQWGGERAEGYELEHAELLGKKVSNQSMEDNWLLHPQGREEDDIRELDDNQELRAHRVIARAACVIDGGDVAACADEQVELLARRREGRCAAHEIAQRRTGGV